MYIYVHDVEKARNVGSYVIIIQGYYKKIIEFPEHLF